MTDSEPTERVGITIQVKPEARRVLKDLTDRTKMKNTDLLTRIVEWFASLDQKLQIAVLWKDEGVKQEMSRLAVEQMAGLDKVGMNKPADQIGAEDAAAAITKLVARLVSLNKENGRALREQTEMLQALQKGQGTKGKRGDQ